MDKIWSIWGDSWTQYKRFCKIEGSETAILICRPFWNNFCFPLSKLARRHFIFAGMLFSSISVHSFKQTAPQNLFEGYVISMQNYANVIISQKCAYPGKLVHTSGNITVYAKFLCGRVILHRCLMKFNKNHTKIWRISGHFVFMQMRKYKIAHQANRARCDNFKNIQMFDVKS